MTSVNVIQKVRGGKHDGEFRAFEDNEGILSFHGFFKSKEEAEDFIASKPISQTKVVSNFKKTKKEIANWDRRSKEQVKLFSQMYA